MHELQQNILFGFWAIHQQAAIANAPIIKRVLNGEPLQFGDAKTLIQLRNEQTKPVFYAAQDLAVLNVDWVNELSNVNTDSIAVLSIAGVISKNGAQCAKGTVDTMRELEAAGRADKVKGVVLRIDSPGGTVNGTETIAKAVREFRAKYKKPIAAVIDDMTASAAYWIASGVDRIFVQGETSVAGSIGTVATLVDETRFLDEIGVDIHTIYASKSFNKNKDFNEALEGNYEPLRKELDILNEVFISSVKAGRRGKLNTSKTENGVPLVFTGQTWIGKEIVEMGLADEMGGLKAALDWINQGGNKKPNEQDKNMTNQSSLNTSQNSKITLDMSIKSFFKSMFTKMGVTEMKNEKGENLSIDQAVEALENDAPISESLVNSLIDARMAQASEGNKEATQTQYNELMEANKQLQARIDALEANEKAIKAEIAGVKGASKNPKADNDGKIAEPEVQSNDAATNRLKSMLDRGLISQEMYNEAIKKG